MKQSDLGFVNKNVENNFPGKLWHELRLVNKKLLPESKRHVFFYKKLFTKRQVVLRTTLDSWGMALN